MGYRGRTWTLLAVCITPGDIIMSIVAKNCLGRFLELGGRMRKGH
jgi:hypothetical protein